MRLLLLVALALLPTGCSWPERRLVPPPEASADATAFLQAELDRAGRIFLPRLPGGRCYRTRGLWVDRSGTQLISDGACLEISGPGPVRIHSPDGDPIPAEAALYVTAPFGVRLQGLRLVVPKEASCYGIAVFGRNVEIDRVTVDSEPIDALVVGGRGSEPARDVRVRRSRLLGGQRNVVSVVAAIGLRIERSVIAGASPGNPSAGIDIEPDDPEDQIGRIRIAGNRIVRNAGPGILLALNTTYGLPLQTSGIEITGNRITGNSKDETPPQKGGIAIQGGQADGRGWARITGNVIGGNGGAGLQGHPTEGTILRLEVSANDLRGNEDGPTSFVRVGRGSRIQD